MRFEVFGHRFLDQKRQNAKTFFHWPFGVKKIRIDYTFGTRSIRLNWNHRFQNVSKLFAITIDKIIPICYHRSARANRFSKLSTNLNRGINIH